MSTKIINIVVVIENVLCIHRNYCLLSKVWRLLLWLRLLVEFALNIIDIFFQLRHYSHVEDLRGIMFYILNISSSSTIIILALYQSKTFNILLSDFAKNHSFFSKDTIYVKKLDQIYKAVIFFCAIYPIMPATIQIYNNFIQEHTLDYIAIIHFLLMFMCNVRFITEYICLWALLCVLAEQMKSMTRRISEERVMVDWRDGESVEIEQEVTSFDEWTAIYMNIEQCSNSINCIFGFQIIIILITTIFYFLICLYSLAFNGLLGLFLSPNTLFYLIKSILLQVALFALCRSAQAAQNSVDEFRRRLGKLLILSLSAYKDNQMYKETKELLRLISNRPIRTQAFGSINIDMTLVPKFIMFYTSYTITALQFNNLV